MSPPEADDAIGWGCWLGKAVMIGRQTLARVINHYEHEARAESPSWLLVQYSVIMAGRNSGGWDTSHMGDSKPPSMTQASIRVTCTKEAIPPALRLYFRAGILAAWVSTYQEIK